MDWTEVSVATNTGGADIVSAALMQFNAKGTQIIDRADAQDPERPGAYWDIMDQSVIDAMPEEVTVKAWFDKQQDITALQEHLLALPQLSGMDLGMLRVHIGHVHEQDWAENWKRFYKPFRLGRRLVVRPSWEAYDARPEDLLIHLDPGMAFGTGTHESTALCAGLLEQHMQPGDSVLDVGTGSGILAIAAARLGASCVTAVDIDPVAVRTARENVAHNGLEGKVLVRQGDLLQGEQQRYDLAVANILADVIIGLGRPMLSALKPGGVFLCSGIIRERARDVLDALLALNYTLLQQAEQGEWVALAMRAPEEG